MSKSRAILPNLFISGVQKAGTTAIASFLEQHPDVCLVKNKEAHVFDNPQLFQTNDKAGFIYEKYAEKLTHYNGEKYILDATPITILHPQFIAQCAEFCSEAKHIVMLRDPVERALSHYSMSRSKGREELSPINAFLNESKRLADFYEMLPLSDFKSKYRDNSYLIRGLYKRQLRSLRKYFEEDAVKVLNQNDLLEKHHETLMDIFAFLELPEILVPEKRVFKTEEDVTLPIFTRLALRLYFKFADR